VPVWAVVYPWKRLDVAVGHVARASQQISVPAGTEPAWMSILIAALERLSEIPTVLRPEETVDPMEEKQDERPLLHDYAT